MRKAQLFNKCSNLAAKLAVLLFFLSFAQFYTLTFGRELQK